MINKIAFVTVFKRKPRHWNIQCVTQCRETVDACEWGPVARMTKQKSNSDRHTVLCGFAKRSVFAVMYTSRIGESPPYNANVSVPNQKFSTMVTVCVCVCVCVCFRAPDFQCCVYPCLFAADCLHDLHGAAIALQPASGNVAQGRSEERSHRLSLHASITAFFPIKKWVRPRRNPGPVPSPPGPKHWHHDHHHHHDPTRTRSHDGRTRRP